MMFHKNDVSLGGEAGERRKKLRDAHKKIPGLRAGRGMQEYLLWYFVAAQRPKEIIVFAAEQRL